MIRRAKGFEQIIYFLIIYLSTFGSKVFLTLKIMDFESVALTKGCKYKDRGQKPCRIVVKTMNF
jgi:hypothetical protein